MIFLVEIDVRVERRCARSGHDEEEIEREDQVHRAGNEDCWNKEVGRVVSFVTTIGARHEMASGIDSMVESDVLVEERATEPMVGQAVMQ